MKKYQNEIIEIVKEAKKEIKKQLNLCIKHLIHVLDGIKESLKRINIVLTNTFLNQILLKIKVSILLLKN